MKKNKKPLASRPIDQEIQKLYSWRDRTFIAIKKTKVKTWQGVLILAFIAGTISAVIMNISLKIQSMANANGETARLSLDSSNINVMAGQTFRVNIMLDTNGNNVVVTRAIINYDPNNITLTGWDTTNSIFAVNNSCIYNNKPCEIINNDTQNGSISITLAKPSPGVNTRTGLVAQLTFQTNSNAQDNDIQLYFDNNNKYSDSDVIFDGSSDDGEGTDILRSVSNAHIHIVAQDTTPPVLSEITPVTSPTSDATPNYTFDSSEAGRITYKGTCKSTVINAVVGNNTITFDHLPDGTYSDCAITVTDASNNVSNVLNISPFTIRSQSNIVATRKADIKIKYIKIKTDRKRGFIDIPKYKTVYSKENKIKFREYISGLIGGKVQIYVDKKLKDTIKLKRRKLWTDGIKIKDNGSHIVRFKYLDSNNRLIKKSRKYRVRIDTKKPKFKEIPHLLVKHRGEKIWWKAIDNNKINYYKYYFNGRKKVTKKSSFIIPVNTSRGVHLLKIKAYDKAGNRAIKYVVVSVL